MKRGGESRTAFIGEIAHAEELRIVSEKGFKGTQGEKTLILLRTIEGGSGPRLRETENVSGKK